MELMEFVLEEDLKTEVVALFDTRSHKDTYMSTIDFAHSTPSMTPWLVEPEDGVGRPLSDISTLVLIPRHTPCCLPYTTLCSTLKRIPSVSSLQSNAFIVEDGQNIYCHTFKLSLYASCFCPKGMGFFKIISKGRFLKFLIRKLFLKKDFFDISNKKNIFKNTGIL